MKSVEEVAKELAGLQHYRYSVERYLAGLQRLTVVARPMKDSHNEGSRFITFRTVKYIQMPTYWEGAPFKLGTFSECRELLERVGIPVVGSLPCLFYAELSRSCVYVVCWDVEVSNVMPP